MKRLVYSLALTLSLFSFSIKEAQCQEEPKERTNFLGDLGGVRDQLDQSGLAVESVLSYDIISDVSGGLRRHTGNLMNYDLTFTLDTEKADLWSHGTAFLYMLGNAGSDPTTYVGDLQASDNIEAYDTFKVYEAWYDHNFGDGALSVLAGLYDLNSEFYALDYAGTLINSSFGIGVDVAQVGPSIFSTTALALRLKSALTESTYVQGAIFDGIPGDPNRPRGTRVKFQDGDGVFGVVEAGCNSLPETPHYKYGVGYWVHTADFEDFNGNAHSHNSGIYAIAEKNILPEEDPNQGLGVFTQLGFTHPDRNEIGNYVGVGLSYVGLIPERDEDVFSLGLAYARNGADFRRATENAAMAEAAVEMTYHAKILPYFSIQPDIQYINNPGATRDLNSALVLGARFEVLL